MKKYIEALETRRRYLVGRLDPSHAAYGVKALDDVLRTERDALDWVLGKVEADPEVETEEPFNEESGISIGATGHFGPVKLGDLVQTKVALEWANIRRGEVGKVTYFDTWVGEEYPYHVEFEGGRTAAFAREDIRKVT